MINVLLYNGETLSKLLSNNDTIPDYVKAVPPNCLFIAALLDYVGILQYIAIYLANWHFISYIPITVWYVTIFDKSINIKESAE